MTFLDTSSERERAVRRSPLFTPRSGHDVARSSIHVEVPGLAPHPGPYLLDCTVNAIGDFLRRFEFKEMLPRLHDKVRRGIDRMFIWRDGQSRRTLSLRRSWMSQRVSGSENSSNIAPWQRPVIYVCPHGLADQLEFFRNRLSLNIFSLKPIVPKDLWTFCLAEALNRKCQGHERAQTCPVATRPPLLSNVAKASRCMPKHGKRLEVPLDRDPKFFFHRFPIRLRDESMREVARGLA